MDQQIHFQYHCSEPTNQTRRTFYYFAIRFMREKEYCVHEFLSSLLLPVFNPHAVPGKSLEAGGQAQQGHQQDSTLRSQGGQHMQ